MTSISSPIPSAGFSHMGLRFAAKGIDKSTVSGDIFCDVWIKKASTWEYLGHTEQLTASPAITWTAKFGANFVFTAASQQVRVDIHAIVSSENKYLGSAMFTLSEIIKSNLELPISGLSAKLLAFGSFLDDIGDIAHIKISLTNSKKKALKKKRIYFVIKKTFANSSSYNIYKSENATKSDVTKWNEFQIPVQTLRENVDSTSMSISIYSSKKEDPIAIFLLGSKEFYTLDKQSIKAAVSKEKTIPILSFDSVSIEKKPTFLQIIRSGLELNLCVAIDFTQSNGDPFRNPSSLHSVASENCYLRAIKAVCEVLCPYDSDQVFPVYGFGGIVDGQVSHCFRLNPFSETVQGMQGIIDAYRSAIQRVQLYGPTFYSPVIQKVISSILGQRTLAYTILLIITDGIFNDMQETIDSIVEASALPLSIVIVGVGGADFRDMNTLDADEHPLVSRNNITMRRDIVQFVSARDYEARSKEEYSEAILNEIPRQVVTWAELVHYTIPD